MPSIAVTHAQSRLLARIAGDGSGWYTHTQKSTAVVQSTQQAQVLFLVLEGSRLLPKPLGHQKRSRSRELQACSIFTQADKGGI